MKLLLYIKALLLLFIAFSCEKETEIDTNNYVVNSFISDGTPLVVRVTKTVSVYDTATYSTVKDIEGELYEDGKLVGELVFQKSYGRQGIAGDVPEGYTVKDFVPKQGKNYSFELRHKSNVVKGSDEIPDAIDFTISDTSTVADDYDKTPGIECILKFKDKVNEKNFYVLAYNITEYYEDINKTWVHPTGWMKSDDPAMENQYYHNGLLSVGQKFIFSDKYFDGREYSLPVSFFVGHNSGKKINLNIYLLSISEKYYNYITSMLNQKKNNDDYYAEPTQVYNNIQNGFGIFAGFSYSKKVLEFGR